MQVASYLKLSIAVAVATLSSGRMNSMAFSEVRPGGIRNIKAASPKVCTSSLF